MRGAAFLYPELYLESATVELSLPKAQNAY
jgi:hypothetical protein